MKIKKSLYNLVFRKKIEETNRIWNFLYQKLLSIDDATVNYLINNQACEMPFSHRGVWYAHMYQNYDKQLGQICKYVKQNYNRNINIIDVGANIGDTVLNIGDTNNQYLLVEGDEDYYKYIKNNLTAYKYVLETCFCGEGDEDGVGVSIQSEHGTARLTVRGECTRDVSIKTMDSIVFARDFEPDVFKIDTDGFDFKVLRGSQGILEKYKPVLYFEWTLQELEEIGENPVSIFQYLLSLGYDELIIFDNFGNLVCLIKDYNISMLKYLIEYTRYGKINYFDICALHKFSDIRGEGLTSFLLK